jgi:RNA polymerase sigma-70 factor (ECF subfamily)
MMTRPLPPLNAASPAKARALDAYVVAAARCGDRAALALLAARWQRRLQAHALRLTGDGEMAGDVVQSAWVEILRGLPRLDVVEAFPAWAYRIVTRRCAGAIRGRQQQRALAAAIAAEPPPPDQEPVEPTARLHAAIQALPPDQRAAIALVHFEHLSVAEVAVSLSVPVGTVKTRLMYARRKLRAILEGDEP